MNVLPRQPEPEIDEPYFRAAINRPVHFIYEQLEPNLPKKGVVLELGFGAGNGVLWFLERGFEVVAIDKERLAIETLMPRLPANVNIEIIEGDMDKIDFPKVDVIAAGFSLFMLPKKAFPRVWRKIKNALPRGGLLAVNLLGNRDEWCSGERSTHSRRGAKALFREFDILYWEEHEREGTTIVDKAKYWHVFHVVARKR